MFKMQEYYENEDRFVLKWDISSNFVKIMQHFPALIYFPPYVSDIVCISTKETSCQNHKGLQDV